MRLIIEVQDMDELAAELLLTELVNYALHVEAAPIGQAWVEE